jgi:S1-C subfamily serine protease
MAAIVIESSLGMAGVSSEAASVAEALLDRVVLVRAGWGSGSGVIWEPDGLIVTNSHVMHHDEAMVLLRDGTELHAKLVARDPQHDLAALQVNRRDLPAVTPGDSTRVRVGQLVLAVGNPLGLRNVVTAGIITAVGRIGGEAGPALRHLIQADVALAPGNSGGPLADAEGRVLGINTMVGVAGMALAIPTSTVQQFLALRNKNRVYIGIEGVPVQVRVGGKPRGAVLLTTVEEGSPAASAGLLQGDVLLSFDGDNIETGDQFQSRLFARKPGDPLRLVGMRGERPAEFTVIPVERITA